MSEQNWPILQIRILKDGPTYPLEFTIEPSGEFFDGFYLPNYETTPPPTNDGLALFNWLITADSARQTWTALRSKYPHCRLRLWIDADVPELHAISWERLQAETILSASAQTPFSRYVPSQAGDQPPLTSHTLRVLVVIASPDNLPTGLAPIDTDLEWQLITSALENFAAIELTRISQPATLTDLTTELEQGYHIVHIVAHGQFNHRKQQAALLLTDANNKFVRVVDTKLASAIARLTNPPKLIFLAVCQSASRSQASALRGLAPQLIEAGVPTVIAMQDNVPIETARVFSQTFYEQLALSCQVDIAANRARNTLLTSQLPGNAIPVLFSRLHNNRLLAEPIKPRLPFEPETVYIPAGQFITGLADDPDNPQRTINVASYRLGKYPVTVAHYAEFIKQSNHPLPKTGWYNRQPDEFLKERLSHPVTGISQTDALAYCRWLSEQTGRPYSLPTEAQWEKAARGTDGRLYPWGKVWQADYCNGPSNGPTVVDAYSPGVSPYGCFDMVGNVWEWTTTPTVENATRFRLCGGSYRDEPEKLTCLARRTGQAKSALKTFGFRVLLCG